MADDVVAVLDALKIPKADVVGWSDGGILGIDLALRHKDRVGKVFAFAANTVTSGVVEGVEKNPTFAAYIDRAGHEDGEHSATPKEYDAFVDQISKMWADQPNWTDDQLKAIDTPVLVVDGDHDEAIKRAHTEYIAATIPHAGLLILPNASHFAFLQDPDQFNFAILHFLGDEYNKRDDGYGGSVENRARLLLEVTDAVVSVWGAGRVGVHLAPRGDLHDMGDSNLPVTFGYVARELGKRNIAFLCARESTKAPRLGPDLKTAFGGVYIANEGLSHDEAEAVVAAGEADAVAFGKLFISNPDLARRFSLGAPLNAWNADTFYSDGATGYTDYPALEEKAATE
jgi:NADH:flavin oxidoreductase / NADH oxidase family/Alpha/beta hydrolase family